MPARKVDIVFCLDTSDSMKPCIDAVRANIARLVGQLRQANFDWRLDFVAHHISGRNARGGLVISNESLRGSSFSMLYGGARPNFFTDDVEEFKRGLQALEIAGDEDMLMALDFALDMPFGSANETQRVIVLISDEPFETNEPSAFEEARKKVDSLKKKIQDRHVTLLAIMPIREGGVAESLAEVDRADFTPVEEGNLGLKDIDMMALFRQLGKTISTLTAQSNGEENYVRALFDQEHWGTASTFDRIGDTK